jgi:hypothetical protein
MYVILTVHFGGGIWGVIAIAFLDKNHGIVLKWDTASGLVCMSDCVGIWVIHITEATYSIRNFTISSLVRLDHLG